ncbi:MAG: hypothetical protein OXJ56_03285, partial [Rhodospirillaceae bacterium]|nr:hypothetical protein [Rhodospirillaceae bacterium]
MAILTLALAGCGGGGGGSDPASEPQPPVAPAFRLSSSNVSEASGVVLLLVEEATAAANIVVEAAERLSSQTARSIFGDCRFNDADGNSVTAHDDNDGDGRISAGDSIRFQEGDCDDRDTEIRLDVTEAS